MSDKKFNKKGYKPSKNYSLGLVNSVLGPVCDLIHYVTKGKIRFTHSFWSLVTIFLLVLFIRYGVIENLNLIMVVVLLILVIELLLSNPEFFKRVKERMTPPDEEQIHKLFFNQINKKTVSEVCDFLSEHWLYFKEIEEILQSRHQKSREVYTTIVDTQEFDADLIDYIIDKGLYKHMSNLLLSSIVGVSATSLNTKSFKFLIKRGHKRLKGALALKNPDLIHPQTHFQKITYPLLRFCSFLTNVFWDPSWRITLSVIFIIPILFITRSFWITSAHSMTTDDLIFFIPLYLMGVWALSAVLLASFTRFYRFLTVYSWGHIYRKYTGEA